LKDGVVLEVGTGRTVTLPIILWLLGARRVITVDLHRYLKSELVAADVAYFQSHSDELLEALAECDLQTNRFRQLMSVSTLPRGLNDFLQTCSFQYLAPADAARLPLDEKAVDFHVSTNVFEHIPPDSLASILREAGRVLRSDGLAVHRIDHSDHFSHSDHTLSPINFLRCGEREWARLAGNRYMYMNRLQVDDYQRMFAESGHEVLDLAATPDETVLHQLHESPPPLDSRFAGKPLTTLATMNSLFVSRPRAEQTVVVQEQAA
jgi:SAM-dependent methyltransferase